MKTAAWLGALATSALVVGTAAGVGPMALAALLGGADASGHPSHELNGVPPGPPGWLGDEAPYGPPEWLNETSPYGPPQWLELPNATDETP
jgi:hypothetical protein